MLAQKTSVDVTDIMVTVCCVTYNHEKFIREAIEGFLMQKISFPIEIIIHDDASIDRTQEIIKEYAKLHPDIIVPIYQKENQYSKGMHPWRDFVFPKVRGKYIAFCEGDDYWTKPYKLQQQVDFLEGNVLFSASAHQSVVMYEDSAKSQAIFREDVKPILGLNDVLIGRAFHTASFVCRAEIIKKYQLPKDITSTDRAIFILCATQGPIKYFDETMCVYRKSVVGISSWVSHDLLIKDLAITPWLVGIYPRFPKFRFLAYTHKTIVTYPKKVPFKVKIKHWLLFSLYSFSYFPRNIYEIAKLLIRK